MCLSVPCWSLFSKDDGHQGAGLRAGAKRCAPARGAATWQQRLPLTSADLSSLSNCLSSVLPILRQSVLSAGAIGPLSRNSAWIVHRQLRTLTGSIFLSPSRSTEDSAWVRGILQEWIIKHLQAWVLSPTAFWEAEFNQFIAPISCSKAFWGEHPLGHTGANPVAV